jgi:hypothetical protein
MNEDGVFNSIFTDCTNENVGLPPVKVSSVHFDEQLPLVFVFHISSWIGMQSSLSQNTPELIPIK